MAVEVSVVMPCLNEEETLGICIDKAFAAFKRLDIEGEVVVADNGSTDNSVEIAKSKGARVIHESKKGYGHAYRAGIDAAQSNYIVIGDSDDSYDFNEIGAFIEPLRHGVDMVMGTRLKGKIEKGAMPWLHRYIGNPVLTGILNLFYRSGISDAHCGMRSFTKEAYKKMHLQTTGMEFASEIVINATKAGLKIEEIPITLHPDGRSGKPHLRSFRDGWRHLRFMLMHSPTHLFLIPGLVLFVLGLAILLPLVPGPIYIAGRMIDIHFMALGSLLAILGFQIINIGFYAKIYSVTQHFVSESLTLRTLFRYFNLERGLLIGVIIFLLGFFTDLYILIKWISSQFGPLNELRLVIFASTLMIIGAQTIFSSFFLSMLGIETRKTNVNS